MAAEQEPSAPPAGAPRPPAPLPRPLPQPLSPSLAQTLQAQWLTGGALSTSLLPLSGLYRLLWAGRSLLYQLGILKPEALPVPVIVVGNWIVGGAGKTPTTLALLQLLKARGIRAGVVSRGYGREDDAVALVQRDSAARQVGDEPLLIHLRSGVPVAVGRDRVAAARALLQAHPELQLLISDDGLQHGRLPRALSVLVFDSRGIGNGHVLPAGPLRQPFQAQLPADHLVLYNADRPSTALPGFLAQRMLAGAVSLQDWWAGKPAQLEHLQALRGRPLAAAAGMAQPARFFDMLEACGLTLHARHALPDHYDFAERPWGAEPGDLLVTEKDAVKLRPTEASTTSGPRIWVVALDFRPEAAFAQALHQRLSTLGLASATA